MNTLVLTVVSLTLAQPPLAPFDSGRAISPVQATPLAADPSEENAIADGGRFRLTDEPPARPAPPTEATELPRERAPMRNWSAQESRATATRAQAQTQVMPLDQGEAEALAGMILDRAIEMRADEGIDVALADLLRRSGDNDSRQRAVQIYWRLCMAIAEHNFASDEARYLSELARPQSQLDESLLTAEVAEMRARQATAAMKVLELQETLSDVGRLETNGLPRPIDRPFVGPYATHFETLFANRPAPIRLKRIARHLPYQLEVIERRADAVSAGEHAGAQLAQAYARGEVGLSQVLDSLERLSHTRRDLLADVLTYNEQIAEYSFSVVGPGVSPESLLGTLIRREVAAQPTMLADANVRPASAEAPVLEPGEVDRSVPLRPIAEPRGSLPPPPTGIAPGSQSILKRITIDHP